MYDFLIDILPRNKIGFFNPQPLLYASKNDDMIDLPPSDTPNAFEGAASTNQTSMVASASALYNPPSSSGSSALHAADSSTLLSQPSKESMGHSDTSTLTFSSPIAMAYTHAPDAMTTTSTAASSSPLSSSPLPPTATATCAISTTDIAATGTGCPPPPPSPPAPSRGCGKRERQEVLVYTEPNGAQLSSRCIRSRNCDTGGGLCGNSGGGLCGDTVGGLGGDTGGGLGGGKVNSVSE